MKTKMSLFLKFSLLISVVVSLLCAFFLSNNQIITTVIFFGQAHFLLAYLYAGKYGRFNKIFLIKFLILVATLGSFCFFVTKHQEFFPYVIFLTSVLFTFHYFNDEFKIRGLEKVDNKIFAVTSVVFSFISVFLIKIFSSPFGVSVLFLFFSIMFALFFIYQDKEYTFKKNKTFFIFFAMNIFFPLFFIFKKNVSAAQILGFIILFHYMRWYLYYLDRFSGPDLSSYKDAVIWCNLFVLLTFIIYTMVPGASILYVFYSPLFFYAWSVVHIVLFIRKEDYLLKY